MDPNLVRVDAGDLAGVIYRMGDEARAALRDIGPAVADALVVGVADVYEAAGPGWAPLAPATQEARRKGRGSGSNKILRDTGVMADTSSGFGPDWVEAWSPASYADFHATGTRFMPKRNPFDLGPFEADVLEDVADLIAEAVT